MLRGLLANDTSLLGEHGAALGVGRLVALAREAGIALERGHGWKAIEALPDFRAYDLIIVNGEKSLQGEARTARRIADLVARVGPHRPVHLVNTVAENVPTDLLAKLAAARSIVARDAASAAAFAAAGLAPTVVPDATLTTPIAQKGSGGALAFTDALDADLARDLGRAAARAGSVVLRFDADPGPDRDDPLRLKVLRRRLRLRRSAAGHDVSISGTHRFLSYIAREVSGLVSARFHGTCLALRLGVPFLAVETEARWTKTLLQEIGMGGRLIQSTELSHSGLLPPPFSPAEEAARAGLLARADHGWRALMASIAADARTNGANVR